MTILAEIFQIRASAIPVLTGYRLDIQSGDLATIGGKLALRLQKAFSGHWMWSRPWIVTDTPQPDEAITSIVETLWQEQPMIFQGLHSVRRDSPWQPIVQVQADFVARGLWIDMKPSIMQLLATWSHPLGSSIRVHRSCEVRGWVVQEQPAISVSIDSRLIATRDVQSYAKQLPDPSDLMGLMVADKTSTMKGTITKVMGTVAQHRDRLLKVASTEPSKAYIRQAAEDELVVQVHAGQGRHYDYVACALQIIVRTADYTKFHVDPKQATQALRLSPEARAEMIKQIAALAKAKHLVNERAYSSSTSPATFLTAQAVNFTPSLLIGGGQRVDVRGDRDLYLRLHRSGFYKRSADFPIGEYVHIGVLNALPEAAPDQFLQALQNELQAFKFASQITHIETVRETSRNILEQAITRLSAKAPSMILALLADDGDKVSEDETQWGVYEHLKSLAIGMGMPSQVVMKSTMSNTFALGNIVLGMLSKLGNIPYVLAEPLSYVDIIVGIDIARRKKERLAGSMNATAIARMYQKSGEFLQYVIHDAPLEGETIPPDVLHALFPSSVFSGKRVVIHRDGLFRGDEKQALHQWAKQLGAVFHCVEVLKTGTPRIYGFQGRVLQPPKGSAFKLNEYEAFLVSSLPPFPSVTPYPLRLRSEAPFPIEQAIHSVLALTLLHYGSLRTPRLPVTIHYSDEIAYLALKGIKPKALDGTLPFWL
jgi:argonaute-like protein